MSSEKPFVHLHLHSHYSLLDGMSKVADIVNKVKEIGSPAVALTDHGVMHGVVELYRVGEKEGIKPVLGFEAYIINGDIESKTASTREKNYHLTLLAKNATGYRNLMKMVTLAHLKGYYYKPRINKEILKAHSEGVIVLSGCLQGELVRLILEDRMNEARELIKWFRDIFKDDYYLEVQYHPNIPDQTRANEVLKELSKEFDIPLVMTTDSHYVNEEDADAQDILACVQTGATINDAKRFSMKGELFHIQTPEELYGFYRDDPVMTESLRNTVKVAEKADLKLELGGMILPKLEIPAGETYATYMRKMLMAGLKERYGDPIPADIMKRADYEFSVIEKMGYESYFLIVADYVNWAKSQGIAVGPGRGSVAGSIIAYALKITGVDPIEQGLLFERFLNPERVSMPDIDIDFADDRRDEVIDYVSRKYGSEQVSQIITFGTMASRAAVRDVGRALGMPYMDVDQIAKLIPAPIQGKHVPLKKILTYSPDKDKYDANDMIGQAVKGAEDVRAVYRSNAKAKELLDLACKLEGTVRHASTHAAGVVIGDAPLVNYTPIQLSTRAGKTTTVTQYAMGDLEAVGLLKMDFLGLRNLSIIQNTLRIIRKTRDEEIDIEKISVDDKKTYELLTKGLTVGVFQFESEGMRRYLQELKPTVLEDLTAMAALYRPGPISSIPDFISAKHGRKEIEYLHPSFESILRPTYGVITYQEQVFEIARAFAGFTYGQADILRKAMGKKIKSLMDEQKDKFVEGAIAQGHSKELAERVWQFIEPFASYGFNKSHAACYGLIAYQTAYLKANYAAEFMASVLTADQDTTEKIAKNTAEASLLGLAVLPPSINESFTDFAVVKGTNNIRYGLNAIKNVGHKISETIVEERKENGPFKSLGDFATRVDHEVLNKKTLESLIKAGALDDFGERNSMLAGMERIASAGNRDRNQLDIFGNVEEEQEVVVDLPVVDAASEQEKLAWEKELLGIFVSKHPLEDFQHLLDNNFIQIERLESMDDKQTVWVAGIISRLQKITTRTGEPMFFANLEDLTGTVETVIFPKVIKEVGDILALDKLVIVGGKINVKDRVLQDGGDIEVVSEVKLIADIILPLSEESIRNLPALKGAKPVPESGETTVTPSWQPAAKPQDTLKLSEADEEVVLHIPKEFTNGSLQTLRHLIDQFPGEKPLILEVYHNDEWQKVPTSTKVKVTEELTDKLNRFVS